MTATAPFISLLSNIVDNRGRTCPTADRGLPLIATNCVKNTTLYPVLEKVRYVDQQTYSTWFRGHPLPGDLIFVCKGSPGQVCITPDPVNFCIAQDMVAVRADPTKIYPPYLFAALRSDEVQNAIVNMQVGTLIPHFKKGDFDKLEIPLPDERTQNFIGDMYLSLTEKIELNRRMNETLGEMSQAIFQDWFVDFGPVRRKAAGELNPVAIMGGLTPDPAHATELAALFPATFADSGLPTEWVKEPLLDQAHWINGAAYKNMHFVQKDMGLAVVKIAELKAGISDQTKFTNTDLGQKYRINDGELLFSWSGNPDTSIDAFIWTGGEAWLNQHIFAVRENGKMNLPALHAMLKWLMPQFAELAKNKQTTGLGHVTKDDMKRLLIAKPPQPVAAAFSTFAGPIFQRIVTILHEIRTLAEIRDYLLSRLMSGEVSIASPLDEARR